MPKQLAGAGNRQTYFHNARHRQVFTGVDSFRMMHKERKYESRIRTRREKGDVLKTVNMDPIPVMGEVLALVAAITL